MRTYPEYVPPLDPHEKGLVMRTVGWTLLVFDALFIVLFAPASLRDGSVLFVVWSVGQALVAFALIFAGIRKEEITARVEGDIVAVPPVFREPHEPKKAA